MRKRLNLGVVMVFQNIIRRIDMNHITKTDKTTKGGSMRQTGKIGKINREANKTLKKLYEEMGTTVCERCGGSFGLSWHHRHKRVWYRSCPEKLSEHAQTILLCAYCHNALEYEKDATRALFNELRGEECLN